MARKTDFQNPKDITVGTLVMYMRDNTKTAKRYPAVVKQVSADPANSTLKLVSLNGRNAYNGVRHKDDPWLVDHPNILADNGCWEESPLDMRLRAVEETLADLVASVTKPGK